MRHRTIRSKGCLSNKTALAMVFKLVDGAQKTWRRLDGHNQLPKIILGVKFTDGIEVIAKPADRQPKPPPPDRSGRHQNLAIAPAKVREARSASRASSVPVLNDRSSSQEYGDDGNDRLRHSRPSSSWSKNTASLE